MRQRAIGHFLETLQIGPAASEFFRDLVAAQAPRIFLAVIFEEHFHRNAHLTEIIQANGHFRVAFGPGQRGQ